MQRKMGGRFGRREHLLPRDDLKHLHKVAPKALALHPPLQLQIHDVERRRATNDPDSLALEGEAEGHEPHRLLLPLLDDA